jgi:hypothetical protein
MTIWIPKWSIAIDGVEYKDITLSNLTISSGRTDIYEQAVAGYCNVTLIELDGESITPAINSSITISIEDSTSTMIPIFGGSITDIIVAVNGSGTGGVSQTVQITALGALSRLPKVLTDGVLSKDLDGVQIASVLEGILYGAWNEVAPALSWANYLPATTTWANAENSGLGEIDAGNYELTDRTASTTDAYSLVAALANSGLGYLYEDAQGRISYADSTHRSQYFAANGYVQVTATHALSNGLQIATRAGDVRNKVTVQYKNNQQVSDEDPQSIAIYGSLAQSIQTTLEHVADATSQAAFYLALRAYPRANFNQITFPLGSPEIDDSDRDNLLGVFMGLPLQITDLPINMGLTFEGFVEGWQFSAGYNSLNLSLYLTPLEFSLQAMKWEDVASLETWNTLSSILSWQDALIVA